TLDILKKDNILIKLQPKIKYLEKELAHLSKHKKVGNIRHCGLMVGIEIVEDKKTSKSYDYKLKLGAKVCTSMRNKGIIIRNLGNTLVLFLPLTITKKEISKIVTTVKEETSCL
ncbi:MAG: aminotransferase class III-fold pyridoxal phosphate-dependent enzyme, partial [Endomicrobium sp.]|nr:aminotransferase class III-fold pyridoxal phosphate-dependent enzyme [Endomicrobium sp.]